MTSQLTDMVGLDELFVVGIGARLPNSGGLQRDADIAIASPLRVPKQPNRLCPRVLVSLSTVSFQLIS